MVWYFTFLSGKRKNHANYVLTFFNCLDYKSWPFENGRQCLWTTDDWVGEQFSSVQSLSRVQLCKTMDCSMPGLPVHHQLLELAQTHVHRVGEAIQPSHPLYLLLLPSIFPSIRVFSNESALCIRWPKYWSVSFAISPSNEYSGLISFRIDWFDLLAVQGILKSLQHHSSKASVLRCSAFFMVQLLCSYMITGKTIALTRHTFISKVKVSALKWTEIA